jgi:hypothetical protein
MVINHSRFLTKKSLKEMLIWDSSQRLSITIHYLATVVTSEDLKFSFGTYLSLCSQTVTEWNLRSSVDRILNVCDIAQQIATSFD